MELEKHPFRSVLVDLVETFSPIQDEIKDKSSGQVTSQDHGNLFKLFTKYCAILRKNPIDGMPCPEQDYPLQGKMSEQTVHMYRVFVGLQQEIEKLQEACNIS